MNSFTEFPANDATAFLTQTEFFSGIDPELFARITRNVQSRKFRTDQVVCGVGEPPKHIFIVSSGLIKRALVAESGHESVADLVAPGQSFGETEFFSRKPFAISAVAVEPTVLMCIEGEVIRKAAESDARFGSHLISLMASGRLCSESERAVAPTRSSGERVLDYLVDLADKNRAAGWGSTVKLVTTKQLIAARIGLTPETFSRALRQLSVEGKILVDRRHVTLRETVTPGRSCSAVNVGVRHAVPLKLQAEIQQERVVKAIERAPEQQNRSVTSRDHPNLAAINVAGRQRMLSQRMSKFWLMIQYGISVRHARSMLQKTIVEFEQQFAHLNQLEANEGITQSLSALGDAWRTYRLHLTSKGSQQAAQVLTLGENVLHAAHDLTTKYVSYIDDKDAQLVNLAGRQRMLSQQIAKLYLLQHAGPNIKESTALIRSARAEFSTALRTLMQSSQDSPALKRQLCLVSDQWSAMTEDLDDFTTGDLAKCVSQVSLRCERVVKQLDNVVNFYSLTKKAA